MSLLYDHKTRKAKGWIKIFFILIPVILLAVVFIVGQDLVKKKEMEDQLKAKKEVDIFAR